MFARASPECKIALAQSLKTVTYAPEEVIIQFGDAAHAMFFIGHGFCDVFSAEKEWVVTLQKGAFFGEIALLIETQRTASVKALTYCNLFRLDRVDFLAILEQFPDFKQSIRAEIIRRSEEMGSTRPRESRGSIYGPLEETPGPDDTAPMQRQASIRARIEEVIGDEVNTDYGSSFSSAARQMSLARKATNQWVGFVQRVRLPHAAPTISVESTADPRPLAREVGTDQDRSFFVEELVHSGSPRMRGTDSARVLDAIANLQAQMLAQAQRHEEALRQQQAAIAELTRLVTAGAASGAVPPDDPTEPLLPPLPQPLLPRHKTRISSYHVIPT